LIAVASLVVVFSIPARAEMTQDQIQEMLTELRLIRQALERGALANAGAQQQAPDDKVSVALAPGGFSLGDSKARLVMVEYTDFQCPYCQQFHNITFPQIKANYIDTGKIRFVSRDFPLDFHENARPAAIAGRCAAEQNKFWEMRHAMIANADQLKPDNLVSYASLVKMDATKFKACLASGAAKFKTDIDRNIAEGIAAGVNGTPSFVLGYIDNDKLTGVRVVGALPYGNFEAKIDEMLAKANQQ